MSESIQEIPLDIAEEVQDIAEDITETQAEEESVPVVLEEVKPVMKPKAKEGQRAQGIYNPPSQELRRHKYRKLRWKLQLERPMSLHLQSEISRYLPTQPPLKSQLRC